MELIKEKELSKIIKNNFNLKEILLELDGIVEGHISFVKAVCQYKHKEGVLYIFDLLNNMKMNLVYQYRILYDEKNKILMINSDNGQDIKLTVLEK